MGTEVSYEQARPGLCRLSTGGRFKTCQDLIDQAIVVKPDSILEEACNPEVGISAEFEAVRAEVLDAPLLAVSGAFGLVPGSGMVSRK